MAYVDRTTKCVLVTRSFAKQFGSLYIVYRILSIAITNITQLNSSIMAKGISEITGKFQMIRNDKEYRVTTE